MNSTSIKYNKQTKNEINNYIYSITHTQKYLEKN